MKSLFTIGLVLSLSACTLFGGAKEETPVKAPCDRGVFHAGPYTDEATGKTCNSPGGYCDSDKKCHSAADKCACIK